MNLKEMCYIWGPARGGSHVPRLNLKRLVSVFINARCSLSALPSLSQFGQGRLSLVAISFYALSLLFGPCRSLEFTLAGPHVSYHSVNLSSLNEYLTSHCNLRLCSFLLFSLSFTCIVVVYIICGILINIYIRHIEGKEAFPNYLFWVDVPFLVKVWVHK